MSGLLSILGKGKKKPAELVKSTLTHIQIIQSNDTTPVEEKALTKSMDKVSGNLSAMKFMLYGDGNDDAQPDKIAKLTEELFKTDLLLLLLNNISKFEFEARKDVAQIWNFVLRQCKAAALEYVQSHPSILQTLVDGYKNADIALNVGSTLREIIRHEPLCATLLNTPSLFDPFFRYVQLTTFDIASDAFSTFKLMLTKHKAMCAKFLEKNFEDVFKKYNMLLQSRNYVTKRQSLKLLGDLLQCRSNFNVMIKYINGPKNLVIMMNLLRGKTKAIQFEAFHVFKIFVANPNKSPPVAEILVRNKGVLIKFLHDFHKDQCDEQLNDDKEILLSTLEALDPSILNKDKDKDRDMKEKEKEKEKEKGVSKEAELAQGMQNMKVREKGEGSTRNISKPMDSDSDSETNNDSSNNDNDNKTER